MHPFAKIMRISIHEGFITAFRLSSCSFLCECSVMVLYISLTMGMGCPEHFKLESWGFSTFDRIR